MEVKENFLVEEGTIRDKIFGKPNAAREKDILYRKLRICITVFKVHHY